MKKTIINLKLNIMRKFTIIFGTALFIFSLSLSSCVKDTKTDEEKIQEQINEAEEAKSKHEYSSLLEYNEVIVGLQMKYSIVTLEIEEYLGTDITYIRELNQKLKNECLDALSILEKLSFSGGSDYELKESLIVEIKYHECCYMTERELQILEKIYSQDVSTEEIEEYNSIIEDAVLEFQRIRDNISTSQEKFVEVNGYELEEEENILQKRIDLLSNGE